MLSLVFAITFVGFAAVQYNDEDGMILVWILAYLVPAYVSFSAFRGKFNKELLVVVLLAALAGAINFFPYGHFEGVALKEGMKTPFIESARESLGLAIVAAVASIHLAQAYLGKS